MFKGRCRSTISESIFHASVRVTLSVTNPTGFTLSLEQLLSLHTQHHDSQDIAFYWFRRLLLSRPESKEMVCTELKQNWKVVFMVVP